MRLLSLLAFAACGGMKDPASVADKFVDRYYVESDQDAALPLTTGVATLQLQEELRLTAEARPGQSGRPIRRLRRSSSRTSLQPPRPTPPPHSPPPIRPQP